MNLTREQSKALRDLARPAGLLRLALEIERQAATSAITPVVVKGLTDVQRAEIEWSNENPAPAGV